MIKPLKTYFGLKDRWTTDLSAQQGVLQDTTFNVHENTINPEISSVDCYPPDSYRGKLARCAFLDRGYTQATIVLPDTRIKDWDGLNEELEGVVGLRDYGPDYDTGGSYFTIEIDGFNSRRLEEAVREMVEVIHEHLRLEHLQMIQDA